MQDFAPLTPELLWALSGPQTPCRRGHLAFAVYLIKITQVYAKSILNRPIHGNCLQYSTFQFHITEILLKVALNIINPPPNSTQSCPATWRPLDVYIIILYN